MPHDTRDQLVDFVRSWSDKTEIPMTRFLPWVGIGTSKFYDWRGRFGKVNEHNAWVPRDHWLTDQEKEAIRTFARGHPLEGYRRLTFMMLDQGVVACSPASVYRVLKDAGLLAGQTPGPTKKGTGFVQPVQPHEHWHVDVSYLNIAGTFYFLCSILDGRGRYLVHWEIREQMREIDVETILQRGREKVPGEHPRVITDNGPQFIARDFKEFIRVAGMTHVKTAPYYPRSNGKMERWYKTLKGDCIRQRVPLSPDDARRLVADYVAHYNDVRLHSSIGYVTPKDRRQGRHQHIGAERDRKLADARARRQQLRQAEREGRTTPPPCQPAGPERPAIDFAAVRTAVTMTDVLGLLGFQLNTSHGAQQRGPCPLHGSSTGTSRCFSVNLSEQIFHCFQCGRSGNALDLWAQATRQTPYDAALDLCQRLNIPLPTLPPIQRNREEETVAPGPTTCTMEST
ncbi:MAG: integrase core domain-containing protein [Gemmataceae bacterium]|nr:integrase core domain-containing protein [Gemmataceae bacterium]